MADDFFGNLGKSLKAVGQTATEKTSVFLDSQKKNVQVLTEQKEIEKVYQKIGEAIYNESDEVKASTSPAVRDMLDEIDARNETIRELKDAILKIKGQKCCPACGKGVDKGAAFCPACGAPIPEEAPAPAEEAAEESEAEETEAEFRELEESMSDEVAAAVAEAKEAVEAEKADEE